jgi:hypothetical protein
MENWLVDLETKRHEFLKFYKKFRTINTILMFVVLIAILPVMMFIMPIEGWGTWAAIIIVMVLLAGVFVYGNYMKKKTNAGAEKYIDEYYQTVDQYVFESADIKDYEQSTSAKFTTEQFVNAHILKYIGQSASRNVVTYKVDDKNVAISDYVAYTYGAGRHKRLNALFVGKFIEADNSVEDLQTLIFLKPKISAEGATGPNDHDDLNTIIDDQDIAIYSNKSKSQAVDKEVLSLLEKIPVGQHIVDLSLSILAGKTYIALSLSDRLMNVPLEQSVGIEAINEYKKTIELINKIISKL